MEIQTKVMAKAGFVTAFSMCVNSCEYGLSQSRTRAWVLYIKEPYMKCFVLEDSQAFFYIHLNAASFFKAGFWLNYMWYFHSTAQGVFVWTSLDEHSAVQGQPAGIGHVLECQPGGRSRSNAAEERQARWSEVAWQLWWSEETIWRCC